MVYAAKFAVSSPFRLPIFLSVALKYFAMTAIPPLLIAAGILIWRNFRLFTAILSLPASAVQTEKLHIAALIVIIRIFVSNALTAPTNLASLDFTKKRDFSQTKAFQRRARSRNYLEKVPLFWKNLY